MPLPVAAFALWVLGVGLLAALAWLVFDGNGDSPAAQAVAPASPLDVPSANGGSSSDARALALKAEPATTPEAAPTPVTSLPVTVRLTSPFVWPVAGPITSTMGPQHPLGIDIGFSLSELPTIAAVADGTVLFADGSDAEDYGYHVIIEHANGIRTLYAHLSSILVAEGDSVSQSEAIGIGGDTGFSDGAHLHFEVEGSRGRIDPLHVLPQDGDAAGSSSVDCLTQELGLNAGAKAELNLSQVLARGESVIEARIEGAPESIQTAAVSTTRVKLDTALDFFGLSGEQAYTLAMTLSNKGVKREVTCAVVVENATVTPSFYVREDPVHRVDRVDQPAREPTVDPRTLLPCHHAYTGGTDTAIGGCIRKGLGDYDCLDIPGNAPNHVIGPVQIVGPDEYGLDYPKKDGIGCE